MGDGGELARVEPDGSTRLPGGDGTDGAKRRRRLSKDHGNLRRARRLNSDA